MKCGKNRNKECRCKCLHYNNAYIACIGQGIATRKQQMIQAINKYEKEGSTISIWLFIIGTFNEINISQRGI